LRAKLPEAILRRFDHLAEQGRRPVARVSPSGACGNCHLKLPSADAGRVRQEPDELHVCLHCGCWLHASPEAATQKSLAAAL